MLPVRKNGLEMKMETLSLEISAVILKAQWKIGAKISGLNRLLQKYECTGGKKPSLCEHL